MANTYTQIHLQIVFAVRFRAALINKTWKDELYKYMTGIVQMQKHKMIIINGVEDHVHMLIGFKPHQSLSDLVQDVKGSSSKWINDRKLTKNKFNWQQGFGAFSYSMDALPNVINYTLNQEEHHKKTIFKDEYKKYLKEYEIEFDERYLLKDPE